MGRLVCDGPNLGLRPGRRDIMNARQLLISSASALTLTFSAPALAQEAQARYVRLAELEIDPAQLERFHVAIKEGI